MATVEIGEQLRSFKVEPLHERSENLNLRVLYPQRSLIVGPYRPAPAQSAFGSKPRPEQDFDCRIGGFSCNSDFVEIAPSGQ